MKTKGKKAWNTSAICWLVITRHPIPQSNGRSLLGASTLPVLCSSRQPLGRRRPLAAHPTPPQPLPAWRRLRADMPCFASPRAGSDPKRDPGSAAYRGTRIPPAQQGATGSRSLPVSFPALGVWHAGSFARRQAPLRKGTTVPGCVLCALRCLFLVEV